MNGHSDVLLGLLAGGSGVWQRVPGALSTWGWTAAPFDCWLAARGLETLALRAERLSATMRWPSRGFWPRARRRSRWCIIPACRTIPTTIWPPGNSRAGSARWSLSPLAAASMRPWRSFAASQIPFCPSFGENSTTLSHPASTSHRALSHEARQSLGIEDGTIRLSVGIESSESIIEILADALARSR